jgi:hypothetical protein
MKPDEIEQEIQAKGLTAPRVTQDDIEANIASEHYFTAAGATEGHSVGQIARVAHEVNRAYCQALGDASQQEWEDAPQWQKDSAILGVKLHVCNPAAGPQASHESWMAQKLAEGWEYGPVKDPESKRHPCIVPFDELPREQQVKDYLFRGVVHAVAGTFQGAPQHESLGLLTFCVLVLRNGFTVTGESACASPENFDAELGRKIARQNAITKVWPLMGYALRERLFLREEK